MRRAKDRKHASQPRKELVKQVDSANRGEQTTDVGTDKTSFAKIAERYEAIRLIPAKYVGDTEIAGLRSLRTPKSYLKRLVEHFRNARILSITYSQVDEYGLKRLKEGGTIASANHELALLRYYQFLDCAIGRYLGRETPAFEYQLWRPSLTAACWCM